MAMSETVQSPALPAWRDYYEMCKPRVVLLMLLCTLVGMFLATSAWVSVSLIVNCLLGVALVAGSAAALNHLIDASVDQKMARTENRPVAQGRVTTVQGLIFVGVTGALGLAILAVAVNPLTAWLNFFSWLGYGLIYTLYLKRATSQNIVIGGLFGAAPPLFGWTAVTNSIDGGGLLLVLIIFAWTPPHFWALALVKNEDYTRAKIPMLPVVSGAVETRRQIVIYAVLMAPLAVVPSFIGMTSLAYGVVTGLAGAVFVGLSLKLWANGSDKTAMQLFGYSILYLFLVFLGLVIDRFAAAWVGV